MESEAAGGRLRPACQRAAVEGVAVEADVVAEWVEVGDENCGEFRSDAPKMRTPSAE